MKNCFKKKQLTKYKTIYKLIKYIHINVKNLLFLQPDQIHCMKAELCIYSLCQSFFVLQLKNIYFSAVAKNKKLQDILLTHFFWFEMKCSIYQSYRGFLIVRTSIIVNSQYRDLLDFNVFNFGCVALP